LLRNSFGFGEALGRPITTDDLRPRLRNKDAVMTLAARQIEHRPGQAAAKEAPVPDEELRGIQLDLHGCTVGRQRTSFQDVLWFSV